MKSILFVNCLLLALAVHATEIHVRPDGPIRTLADGGGSYVGQPIRIAEALYRLDLDKACRFRGHTYDIILKSAGFEIYRDAKLLATKSYGEKFTQKEIP